MIYRFDTLGSSNDEAKKEQYSHGDTIVAERQTAGRGQRGNSWLSGEGLNLTLSTILCPNRLEIKHQFILLQAVALAICDMLRYFGLDARIKWTNDIYIGDKKVVGILIENTITGAFVARSVVGIGLNVNQKEFDPKLPNPTSMAVSADREFNREEVLERLVTAIESRFEMVGGCDEQTLVEDYHSMMYRRGELHSYRLSSGEVRQGAILGVEPTGELLIDWESGERGAYLFGAIDFIINGRDKRE